MRNFVSILLVAILAAGPALAISRGSVSRNPDEMSGSRAVFSGALVADRCTRIDSTAGALCNATKSNVQLYGYPVTRDLIVTRVECIVLSFTNASGDDGVTLDIFEVPSGNSRGTTKTFTNTEFGANGGSFIWVPDASITHNASTAFAFGVRIASWTDEAGANNQVHFSCKPYWEHR